MIDVVVSRYKRNVDFVYKLPNVNKVIIYDKENEENPYNIPVNKGNEASVYLKYIVDHYDTLSDFTFFIHDEEFAWHHSDSIITRYNEAVQSNKLYYNINHSILGSIIDNDRYQEILVWYNTYIEKYIPMKSLPNQDWTLGHKGCAQFLVHESLIRMLPKEFYQDLYNWIITTNMTNDISGRFMEWTWHIFWDIFPNMPCHTMPEK